MKEHYQCEFVRCGKARCRSCPHGPYWYAYWWEGGRTRKRYIGRRDPRTPEDAQDRRADAGPPPEPDWREAINSRATATVELACRILGVGPSSPRDEVFRIWRQRMRECHPDRGGSPKDAGFINAAFSYLKARNGW